MRILKKGGAPCDRRIDRRKVAIAAMAALLLSVTSAKADIVDWTIDSSLSVLHLSGGLQYAGGTPIAPNPGLAVPAAPQVPGISFDSSYNGHLYTDYYPNAAIAFLPGGSSAQAAITGSYIPKWLAGVGATAPQPANYGAAIAGFGVYFALRNLDFAPASLGPVPTVDAFGNFTVSGTDVLVENSGYQDAISPFAAGVSHDDISTANTGFPFPMGGVGANIGSVVGNHLVIPVHINLAVPIGYNSTTGLAAAWQFQNFDGQIVANAVPEPGTMTLFAFGIAGLLSYAWRARSRKQLAA